jgi:hypothetical protein
MKCEEKAVILGHLAGFVASSDAKMAKTGDPAAITPAQ